MHNWGGYIRHPLLFLDGARFGEGPAICAFDKDKWFRNWNDLKTWSNFQAPSSIYTTAVIFYVKKCHFHVVVKRAQPLWVSTDVAQMALIMHESSPIVRMEKRSVCVFLWACVCMCVYTSCLINNALYDAHTVNVLWHMPATKHSGEKYDNNGNMR